MDLFAWKKIEIQKIVLTSSGPESLSDDDETFFFFGIFDIFDRIKSNNNFGVRIWDSPNFENNRIIS